MVGGKERGEIDRVPGAARTRYVPHKTRVDDKDDQMLI